MAGPQRGVELSRRFAKADLRALTEEEARRFVGDGDHSPQADIALAWELLCRQVEGGPGAGPS